MGIYEDLEKLAGRVYAVIERLTEPDVATLLAVGLGVLLLAGTIAAIVSLEYVPLTVPMLGKSRTDQAVAETVAYAVLIATGLAGLVLAEQALSGSRRDDTKLALGLFLVLFSLFFCWWIVFGLKGF